MATSKFFTGPELEKFCQFTIVIFFPTEKAYPKSGPTPLYPLWAVSKARNGKLIYVPSRSNPHIISFNNHLFRANTNSKRPPLDDAPMGISCIMHRDCNTGRLRTVDTFPGGIHQIRFAHSVIGPNDQNRGRKEQRLCTNGCFHAIRKEVKKI